MTLHRVLIANRGEIAVRILRAAAERGLETVAIHAEDDADSLHLRFADRAAVLGGRGVAAYLDGDRILSIAVETGADAIHPGYGFLAENADFAEACEAAGLTFVGPTPETLRLFADKHAARRFAADRGVPVLDGSDGGGSLEDARAFLASLGPGGAVMIKAVAGGGGRGMWVADSVDSLEDRFARCAAEAERAFGNGDLYVERLVRPARHIEVQVLGDGGAVSHLGERECSLQRRHQKIVEIAPSPTLSAEARERLCDAAVRLAGAARLRNLATVEFLLDADENFHFIEVNPRLQVEHTVTEAVRGIDLVHSQFAIACGDTLAALGLDQARVPPARGHAMQLRINAESFGPDGQARPASGVLRAYEPPSGPGIRVDGCGYGGYRLGTSYDSLLAKLIVHSPSADFADLVTRAYRALCAFRIEGVATTIPLLQALLRHPAVRDNAVDTGFVESNLEALLADDPEGHPRLHAGNGAAAATPARGRAGAVVDTIDPLAVLDHGRSGGPAPPAARDDRAEASPAIDGPPGTQAVIAPMQGTVVSLAVADGDLVRAGQELLVMDAMKMEHVIAADLSGAVRELAVASGDTVYEGHPLAFIEPAEVADDGERQAVALDLDDIRPDLAEVIARHEIGLDPARPDALERRRKTNQRTARENIADLCDPGSFTEYGALVIAAQRQRRPLDDLIARTPADGMIGGIGRVNGELFPDAESRCVAMSYDYTVLAGTQGSKNHDKKDRMFQLAERWRLPMVFFTEGGGGRPGDTDGKSPAGLSITTFTQFARLSGLVPMVGINSGRCFAGNAAILGCCDVIIATADSSIGMGGPAMIEGGGLGVFRPEEVGPMAVQVPNGVVDIAVEDEAEAVQAAKTYLSFFQGPLAHWDCADQRLLRGAIPENRLRIYDVRQVIQTLADTGSVMELRPRFGIGMVTALIRIEGRPVGIVANNPTHLAGAIDSDGSDKAARFMQLCDAFDIPLVFLCDTPGMMVGPEVEKTALVRHCCRLFVTGANLQVPFFTIVLRKAYGLGAQAMAGGSFHTPFFTVSWPTGEFGGMGLEGAVKLGYRKELAAIEDPPTRKEAFDRMVAKAYEDGKAISMASYHELDDVIDPMESRAWIMAGLRSVPPRPPRAGKRRNNIDAW